MKFYKTNLLSHDISLDKIQDNARKWLEALLTKRQQYMSINKSVSTALKAKFGVSQGSSF